MSQGEVGTTEGFLSQGRGVVGCRGCSAVGTQKDGWSDCKFRGGAGDEGDNMLWGWTGVGMIVEWVCDSAAEI